MIQVVGSTNLSFMFPADRKTAYAYYQDLGRVVNHLPHISLKHVGPDEGQFRVMYETVEMGAYHIRILCDVQADLDETCQVLRFVSVENPPPVAAKSGLNSATARGYYDSDSLFFDEGDQTRIEYSLRLSTDLPTPIALRLVPDKVMNKIADNITYWRIKEIASVFIEKSVAAFPEWLTQNH